MISDYPKTNLADSEPRRNWILSGHLEVNCDLAQTNYGFVIIFILSYSLRR